MAHRRRPLPKRTAHRRVAKGHAQLAKNHAREAARPNCPPAKRQAHQKMATAHAIMATRHAREAAGNAGVETTDPRDGFRTREDESTSEELRDEEMSPEGGDDDGGDDDSDVNIAGYDNALGPDDGGDDDEDVNIVGAGYADALGPDDGGDDDDDVNIVGAELSDEAVIGGFFGDVFHAVGSVVSGAGKGIAKVGKAVGKAGKAVVKSPIVKIAEVGLAVVVPPAGVSLLAATATAEKLIDAAEGAHKITKQALAKLSPAKRTAVVAKQAAQQKAARAVIANTLTAANKGHPDAKRAVKILTMVRKQQLHIRDPKTKGYRGRLIAFTRDRRSNGRQLAGNWARAHGPGKGTVLGTVVVGHGKKAAKLHGWWKAAK